MSGDLDGTANLSALNRLVDDSELLQEVRVEKNVAILVAVVGRAVALRDDLEHRTHHRQVVAVERKPRDDVNVESLGIGDILGRGGEKHALEGVAILETVEERDRVLYHSGDFLQVRHDAVMHLPVCCDTHHKIIVGRTVCLL